MKTGDKVRILQDRAALANVRKGDILTFLYLLPENPQIIVTDAPRHSDPETTWWFFLGEEGREWEWVTDD